MRCSRSSSCIHSLCAVRFHLPGEKKLPFSILSVPPFQASGSVPFKLRISSFQASGSIRVCPGRRRTASTMEVDAMASKRDGDRVPARLEALVHPHVSSFDYFLSQGMHEALAHVEPVEVRVGGRRFEGRLLGMAVDDTCRFVR